MALFVFAQSLYEPLLVDFVRRITGLESQVEWIHREQRLMRAALVLAETQGQGGVRNEANDWEEEAGKLFSEVVDLIDNFVHRSVRESRRGILKRLAYSLHSINVRSVFCTELEVMQIKILQMSRQWTKQLEGTGLIEVPDSGFIHLEAVATAVAAVNSAADKANYVLGQNLLVHRKMKQLVEHVRDQLVNLHSALNDGRIEVLDERSKAWIRQVTVVADEMTGLILKTFESGRQLKHQIVFKIPLSLLGTSFQSVYWPLKYSDFARHVQKISAKIECLYERKATYGIGGFGGRSNPAFKVRINNHPLPRIFLFFLSISYMPMPLVVLPSISFLIPNLVNSIHTLMGNLKSFNGSLSLESITAVSMLMDALIDDVNRHAVSILDNRVKAWMYEIRDISTQTKAIRSAVERHETRFLQFVHRKKIWNQIRQINDRIQDVSSKKLTYDVQITGERRDQEDPPSAGYLDVVISEALQETSPTRISSLRLEQILQLLREQPFDQIGKKVESIIWELRLMYAFLDDVRPIDQQDARVKVWVEQIMEGVIVDAQRVINAYHTEVLEKPGPLKRFRSHYMFPKMIDKVTNGFHEISRIKRTYAIGGIESRHRGRTAENPDEEEMELSTTEAQQVSLPFMEKITRLVMMTITFVTGREEFMPDLAETARLIMRERSLLHALSKDVGEKERLARLHMVWVEEMDKLDDKAKESLDVYAFNQQRWWDIRGRLNLNLRMKSILTKLEEISARRIAYGLEHVKRSEELITTSGTLHQTPPPSVIIEEPGIISFQDDLQAVVEKLLTDTEPSSVFSIVGMEGIGKTTLARLICSNSAVVNRFSCCKMVSTEGDIEVLRLSLQPSEKIRPLVVLDDVKNTEIWDKLSSEVRSKLNGCTIVLTTRHMPVAKNADLKRAPHKLHLLSDDHSWALFTYNLTLPDSPQVLECCRKRVTECGGLPKAIVKLRDEFLGIEPTSEAWLQQLHDSNPDKTPWIERVDMINKGGLPLYLFRCFFYLRRFPADFEFPVRRLIALWMAEGLVRQWRNAEDPPESVAKRYVKELMDRNIIQASKKKLNGEVKECRLPYVLKELWVLNADNSASITCLVHYNPSQAGFSHIQGAITNVSSMEVSSYQDVSSFTSFDKQQESREELRKILKICISNRCFLSLHVLDLEHVFRPKLPKALRKLVRLRYLGLRHTYLETFPSFISNLLNLQTLDLKRTSISTLSVSIWKMHQLRHLYLNESYRSRLPRPPSRKQSFTELHTLWGVFIDEDSPVKDGLDRLCNLKRLGMKIKLMSSQRKAVLKTRLDAVADWIDKLKLLECLRLKSFDDEGRASDMPLKSLFLHISLSSLYLVAKITSEFVSSGLSCQSLTDLTLSGSELDMELKALKDLPKLKILRLLGDSYAGTNWLCSTGSFPQLQVLHLWNLRNLKEWKVEEGALPNIRALEIRFCQSMKVLPCGISYLRTLQKVILTDMPEELTNRFKEEWPRLAYSSTCSLCVHR